MVKNLRFESVKSSLNTLTQRERQLVYSTTVIAILIAIYLAITGVFNYQKKVSADAKNMKLHLEEVISSIQKHKNLNEKLTNLTTKYLNSSLNYEELTNHLDKVAKTVINSDNYELIPSREKIELGSNFLARKFSIKIKQCTYEEGLKLLEALEVGPPPVFLQKLDISKSSDGKSISAIFEIVSIQEKKI